MFILHISFTVALFHASLKGKLSKIQRKIIRYLSSRPTCLSPLLIYFTVNLITKALQNNSEFSVILQIFWFYPLLHLIPGASVHFNNHNRIITSAFVFSPTVVSDGLCKGITCWGEEEAGQSDRLSYKRAGKSSCNVKYVVCPPWLWFSKSNATTGIMKHWLNTHWRLQIRLALGNRTLTLNIATFLSRRWGNKSLLHSSSWKLYWKNRKVWSIFSSCLRDLSWHLNLVV